MGATWLHFVSRPGCVSTFTPAHMNLEQRGEENIPSSARQRSGRIFFFFFFFFVHTLYSLNLFDESVSFLKFKGEKTSNNVYIMTLIYTSYNYHFQASDTLMVTICPWLLRVSLKEHKNGKYYILPNIFPWLPERMTWMHKERFWETSDLAEGSKASPAHTWPHAESPAFLSRIHSTHPILESSPFSGWPVPNSKCSALLKNLFVF